MKLWKRLWNDDGGAVLSAEAVVLGTVAVVGIGAGMSTVSSAVNDELKEVGFAIRSLDQSYCIEERSGCGAWTAGSEFRQQPVEKSLKELKVHARKAEAEAADNAERMRRQLERDRDADSSARSGKDRDADSKPESKRRKRNQNDKRDRDAVI